MSKSGNAFIAATQGTQFTLYVAMKAMGIPLSKEQEECQKYLESKYPPVADKVCLDESDHYLQQHRKRH